MALQSFRVNPFHTFLSCLGIIIGVGALFSILALADGIEQTARDRISLRGNLKSFNVGAITRVQKDGIWIAKDSFEYINIQHAYALQDSMRDSKIQLMNQSNALLRHPIVDSINTGAKVMALLRADTSAYGDYNFIAGRNFDQTDIDSMRHVIVVTKTISDKLFPELDPQTVIGQDIVYGDRTLSISGILHSNGLPNIDDIPVLAATPITIYDPSELRARMPRFSAEVMVLESYEQEHDKLKEYLNTHFSEGEKGFNIASYDSVMEEINQGMLMFKLVMGMIVGISVVVGGIGIMNVMLMSIKERTKEIGVRKAIGASAGLIKWQFLTEALILSFLGCALGVLLGVLFLTAAEAIAGQFIQLPFSWNFSLNTTLVIVLIATLIGLIFGVYPAAQAAKLDPIEAIRRE